MDLGPVYRSLIADVYELAGSSRRAGERIALRHGLTVARWHVLSVASGGAMTVPAVAERLGQRRQSVQSVAHDLVAEGLAEWEPNPAHRRSALLQITSAGSTALAAVVAETDRVRAAALARAGVTGEDLRAARATIGVVLTAVRDDAS